MYIARVLYPVEVLGPGRRIGIWFCGCPRRCRGCSNPELWEVREEYRTDARRVYELARMIAEGHDVDGFTITGGDPMMQPDALCELTALLGQISGDILVYTGYKRADLPDADLKNIAVLIDGEYIEERNTNCLLRGSDNQTIHILNEAYRARYEEYLAQAENRIQNFMMADGVVSVGIHRPDFLRSIGAYAAREGK